MARGHQPVLLGEVLDNLAVRADGIYVDATFGRGGHARGILARLGAAGRLVAIDRDPEAVAAGMAQFGTDPRVVFVRGNFGRLRELVRDAGVNDCVNGILLDLGVSSPQLDRPERGFSFHRDGPLDMRMDPDSGTSAADWLAAASEQDIAEVIKAFGEERHARRIARAIVAARAAAPITRTRQLADIVSRTRAARETAKHPATRTFQALRIFINRELGELETCLAQCVALLAPAGRVCVISFHSLEDRIVKRYMRKMAQVDPVYAGLPEIPHTAKPLLRLAGKAIRPAADECAANPRARSAILRVAERLA